MNTSWLKHSTMQIQHLRNEDIDYARWDECILEAFNSRVYAYTWYLDVVSPEWEALIIGDYDVIMPLPRTKKFGIEALLQPLFCQQLGPFSKRLITENETHALLAELPPTFRLIKLHLNSEVKSNGLKERANFILPLIAEANALRKQFNKNTQRNIRKSKDNSCTLMEHLSMRDMLDLFRWHAKEKKMGLKEKHFERLEHLLHTLINKGALISIGVYSPVNHLCSCGLFIRDEKRLYYLMGASDQMGTEYKGMFRIFDHLIQQYASKNYILDFEGSEIPGVAKFFAGFGASKRPYPIFESYRFGLLNSWLKKRL